MYNMCVLKKMQKFTCYWIFVGLMGFVFLKYVTIIIGYPVYLEWVAGGSLAGVQIQHEI